MEYDWVGSRNSWNRPFVLKLITRWTPFAIERIQCSHFLGTLACTQYPSTPFPASMSRILFGNFLLRDLWPSDLVGMVMGIIQTQSLDHDVDGQDQRIQTSKHVWWQQIQLWNRTILLKVHGYWRLGYFYLTQSQKFRVYSMNRPNNSSKRKQYLAPLNPWAHLCTIPFWGE